MIKDVFKKIFYILFTRRCEICGEVVEVTESLCDECKTSKRIEGEICPKCAREKDRCTCDKDKFTAEYKAVAAPYYYKDSMERAVRRLKNYGFTELAAKMGEEISDTVKNRFSDIDFDCVTCVPLTKKRLKKRGYNQSELLAKEVAKCLNLEYEPLLVKIMETASQRGSSAKERRVNLYGAFDLKEGADVKNKTVLIVDDVKTTGSTLSECAVTLKGGGAKAVYAAAFTVTDKKTDKTK